jgi:hypothetical protein
MEPDLFRSTSDQLSASNVPCDVAPKLTAKKREKHSSDLGTVFRFEWWRTFLTQTTLFIEISKGATSNTCK